MFRTFFEVIWWWDDWRWRAVVVKPPPPKCLHRHTLWSPTSNIPRDAPEALLFRHEIKHLVVLPWHSTDCMYVTSCNHVMALPPIFDHRRRSTLILSEIAQRGQIRSAWYTKSILQNGSVSWKDIPSVLRHSKKRKCIFRLFLKMCCEGLSSGIHYGAWNRPLVKQKGR